MWIDIYPKFNIKNINGRVYNTDELIKFYSEYNFKDKPYIQLYATHDIQLCLNNIAGVITDMRLKKDSS